MPRCLERFCCDAPSAACSSPTLASPARKRSSSLIRIGSPSTRKRCAISSTSRSGSGRGIPAGLAMAVRVAQLHNYAVDNSERSRYGHQQLYGCGVGKDDSMDAIEILTDVTLSEARTRPGVTVIDFWAPWCAPCRGMAPQFERAARLRPQYRFAKVNVDDEPVLGARFGIRSIPTLVVLRDGQPMAAEAGVIGAPQLVEALDRIA